MRERQRIQPYISRALSKRLRAYCGAKGATESAVVEAAVQDYLDGDAKDNALIMRRLDRLGRAAIRQERDVAVVSEAFATFVRLWFAHTPEIPEAERGFAVRGAQGRYQKFLDHVAGKFASGSRLVAEVVREDLAADLGEVVPAVDPDADGAES